MCHSWPRDSLTEDRFGGGGDGFERKRKRARARKKQRLRGGLIESVPGLYKTEKESVSHRLQVETWTLPGLVVTRQPEENGWGMRDVKALRRNMHRRSAQRSIKRPTDRIDFKAATILLFRLNYHGYKKVNCSCQKKITCRFRSL